MSADLEKLVEHFKRFPGVGPRQARRMVYFLFRQNRRWVGDVAESMLTLKDKITLCESCHRHFLPRGKETICDTCADPNRSSAALMIVEKDVDFENIERTHIYDGKYFILGGTVSPLDKDPEEHIHLRELKELIEVRTATRELQEIILACSTAPAGEETAHYVADQLRGLIEHHGLKLTRLGRGLSTGAELEYADSETLKSAFQNRK